MPSCQERSPLRSSRGISARRVADEVDLGRVAVADQPRVDVDLHRARLPGLGQPLGVREARADHEQRVAALDHVVGRLGAEQTDRARDVGEVVRQHRAAVEGLGHAGAEQLGDLAELRARVLGALPDEHGDLLAGVEDLGGVLQVGRLGHEDGARPRRLGGEHRAVRARRVGVLELLDVVGDDDAGRRVRGLGDAHRAVDQVRRLAGDHAGGHELRGDVLVEDLQVDLLLEVGAQRQPRLLADDGHDRLVVELGVVEAVEQVDRARAGRRHAHADLAGELRVRAGGEGGDLLVADLGELELRNLVEGAEQAVDAVARITVDALDAPLGEAVEDERSDGLRHGVLASRSMEGQSSRATAVATTAAAAPRPASSPARCLVAQSCTLRACAWSS
jgi:hypothetical protein